jgi:hypothetical protein
MINITREQFLNFIKTSKDKDDKLSSSTQHYLDYFDRYQQTEKKGNWNWSAFWSIWFFYRRMYWDGLAIGMLSLYSDKLINYITKHFSLGVWKNVLEIGVPLLFIVFVMRYADYMYLRHASKKISKGVEKSGTSKTALIITVALLVCFCSIILCLGMSKT